jgi:hypothetical protein
MDRRENEEEAGNVGSEHVCVSSDCEMEDGNGKQSMTGEAE